MEPDVVEIAPPPSFASGSRTRKPKKATIPEVIDVEQYEFSNSYDVLSGLNLIDPMNKGKAIQVSSLSHNQYGYDHNPYGNGVLEVDDDFTMFQDVFDSKYIPTNVEIELPWGSNSNSKETANSSTNPPIGVPDIPQSWDFYSGSGLYQSGETIYSASMVQPQIPEIVMVPSPSNYDASASSSLPIKNVRKSKEDFLRDFKRFDTVEDFSDHHYASKGKASKQHSKNWVKKVQGDWKILENDLPETIFVRACELRMDLLRAVIIGAEGTPYHDGLFFFDIQFPDNYPSVPPKVYYHSGGLRINPNLYQCGKVCLSLLGTWSGNSREKWLPKESTMLQLLVSIQALILNQKPYFNEPGYERSKGTKYGESHSKAYSENVFILSLKTMTYSMRRPPKHFEEFVRSHYFIRGQDIMKACFAYRDGAPVGSIVKGGVQDVEESSEAGSMKFRNDVVSFMMTVMEELFKLGVEEVKVKPKPPPENNETRKRSRSSR